MTDILDSIAELTHLRNRLDLQRQFAALVAQLVSATGLTLWDVCRGYCELHLHKVASLPFEGHLGPCTPLIQPEHRKCLEQLRPIITKIESSNDVRHLFPIQYGNRVAGLLEVMRADTCGRLEIDMLMSLVKVYGNHAGLLEYGERDELTGLHNRRSFNGTFNQKAADEGGVIAVADIDFFKRINDEFGHLYGDEVLILMSRLLEQRFRATDGLFRFGGEEFLILLGGARLEQGLKALDGFRAAVQSTNFPQVGRVTISIGFTLLRPGDTGAAAFGRADEALYIAKRRGRNQVQCHEFLVEEGSLAATKRENSQVELF